MNLIIILIILLLPELCHCQSTKETQTYWDWVFETSNRIPDTVAIYDYETTYQVPGYEIVTRVIGYNCEVIETGNGYYLIFTNKYESIFKNLYNQKYLQKQYFLNIK